ncbi:MAG: hypothetical protein KGL19_10480, partial [Bacteroidota bacterium]|nr:hypothetical protein [Bacteroidota bacterium]
FAGALLPAKINLFSWFINMFTTNIYEVSDYLHMNWGWGPPSPFNGQGGPNNDGWYNCNVDYTTSPNNRGDFQYFQTIIYNIQH